MSESRRNLFRSAALEASETRFGTPIRQYGLAGWYVTAFIVIALSGAGAFAARAEYARKETVIGTLTPSGGAQRLTAARAGVVDEVLAQEGALVAEGTPLLTISHDSLTAEGQSISSLLRAAAEDESTALAGQSIAQVRAIEAQIAEIDARAQGLQSEIEQIRQDQDIAGRRTQIADEAASVGRDLYARGLLARIPLTQREDALLAAQQVESGIRRERAALVSQLAQMQAQRRRLENDLSDNTSANAREQAQMAERRATLQRESAQLLSAHKPGRLAVLQARPGALVQQGQVLGIVLPANSGLEAELWVPSSAIGFLRPGSEVRLLYDAFPYQKFGVGLGEVRSISQSPSEPSDIPTTLEASEPLYRVVVVLDRQVVSVDGRSHPLSPGMRLTADLVLEKRTLLAWALNPLFSALRRNTA